MSRKIGLGDTFFDPDIDGDIDFDFFGGETSTAEAETAVVVLQETATNLHQGTDPFMQDTSGPWLNEQTANLSNQSSETTSINNNYDCPSESGKMNDGEDVRNLNVGETPAASKGHLVGMEWGMRNGDALPPTTDLKKLDGVEETRDKKSDFFLCENHSVEMWPVGNAEEAEEKLPKEGVKNKLGSSESPENRPPEDEEDGSGVSDCDSASDLYSLTDDEEGDEEDDDYLENEVDLDSDITEVSPLSSANMSPLPDTPKRTPEPKAKRYAINSMSSPKLDELRRRELLSLRAASGCSSSSSNKTEINLGRKKQGPTANREQNLKQDAVDLTVLAKAILELEEERKRNSDRQNKLAAPEKPFVRPRKNMSFTNDEVRRIDHENKRLLRRIIDSQKPRKASPQQQLQHPVQTGRTASSAINRFKELKKIETENLVLLKRLQAAKPTRELSREFLLGANQRRIPESKSSSSIATTRTGSPFVMSPGMGESKGRAGRCCSMGSLHSTISSWSASNTSPTKSKSSKLATNGVGTSHSIASGH